MWRTISDAIRIALTHASRQYSGASGPEQLFNEWHPSANRGSSGGLPLASHVRRAVANRVDGTSACYPHAHVARRRRHQPRPGRGRRNDWLVRPVVSHRPSRSLSALVGEAPRSRHGESRTDRCRFRDAPGGPPRVALAPSLGLAAGPEVGYFAEGWAVLGPCPSYYDVPARRIDRGRSTSCVLRPGQLQRASKGASLVSTSVVLTFDLKPPDVLLLLETSPVFNLVSSRVTIA
jgi:hypothetical protein